MGTAISSSGTRMSGTTAQRPTRAPKGTPFYNETTGNLEVYDGSSWQVCGSDVVLGAKNGAAVAAVEKVGVVQQTVLTLTNLAVTMTDATAAGCHGSHKLYDFPAGAITILGASCNLTTAAGAGGIADNAALVAAVGTAAVGTDNATLTSTEANIIPSTSGTLASGAGTVTGESTTALIATFDGTGTAVDAYLNLAVPDANSSASDTITVNGTVTITWVNHGDN